MAKTIPGQEGDFIVTTGNPPVKPPVPQPPSFDDLNVPLTLIVTIYPNTPTFNPHVATFASQLTIVPIELSYDEALQQEFNRLLSGKIDTFFDNDRVGKTLLNYGNDLQSLLLNWKYDDSDSTKSSIFVKLYEPLPQQVDVNSTSWIVRELTPPLLDQLSVIAPPVPQPKQFLRAPNFDITVNNSFGIEVNNVTLETLLTTGSFDVVNTVDPVIQEWFTTNLEGMLLNVDYTDFNNFVFYSSATKRIEAFTQKLLRLEELNQILSEQSASIAGSVTNFTSSMSYPAYERMQEERIELIRSFDGYEQFLYYNSGSVYSSSFTPLDDDSQVYYFSKASWPKISGSVISVASASSAALYPITSTDLTPFNFDSTTTDWLSAIKSIANEFDLENTNRLQKLLPEYLQNDPASTDFLTFIDMIGHHMDILKVYIDEMPSIYDRDSDPSVGISAEQAWAIASSFGIDLPNQYTLKTLVDYTIGQLGTVDPKVYREYASETWKRFLHNYIFILKNKGTKNALRTLMNVYGVLPTTLQIRETATPSFYLTQSFELYDEQTNTLVFNQSGPSYIAIPISSSTFNMPVSIETRFKATPTTQSYLFTGGTSGSWSVRLTPFTGSYGTVEILSASVVDFSSSYLPLFDGDYFTLRLLNSASVASLTVKQADSDGDIIYSSTTNAATTTIGQLWQSSSYIYLGSNTVPFKGNIDEFRMWDELTSDSTFDFHVKYPGLYNGNTINSAMDDLLVRLSFNQPINLGTSPYVINNESPYIRTRSSITALTQFSASGFANTSTYPYSMNIEDRTVLRYAPNFGGSQFVSNKITIEPPPTYHYTGTGSAVTPTLFPNKSMMSTHTKKEKVLSNNVIGFYFSPTDAINDSIIRSIGNIDLQDYIGDPTDLYRSNYPNLETLSRLYWLNYAYTINYNTFIDLISTAFNGIFAQAKSLVPARSKLLTGIVIEPHILERSKIPLRQLEKDELDNYALIPEIKEMQPIGSFDTLDTSLFITEDDTVDGELEDLNTSVSADETSNPVAYFITIDSNSERRSYELSLLKYFGVSSILELTPAELQLYTQLISTFRPSNNVDVNQIMLDATDALPVNEFTEVIIPYSDFDYIGSTDYFLQVSGAVLVPSSSLIRINQNVLTDKGIWTYGSTYAINDMVAYSGSEYQCTTPLSTTGFISYISPNQDTFNWRSVKYTNVFRWDVRKATQISGDIELVKYWNVYTPFTGYDKRHYRYSRDNRLGTKRHQWLGCENTKTTSFDGGPAVEIVPSAGDVLVVTTGSPPVVRTNDNAGPILDVQ